MESITSIELKQRLEKGESLLLLDVREPAEREEFHIGGLHIPLGEVLHRLCEIPADKPVVVYCRKGIRSRLVIQRLQQRNYNNLINLRGGLESWQKMNR